MADTDSTRFRYIVPVHNEAQTIPATVEKLGRRLSKTAGNEILLIENGSSDNSAAVVQSLAGHSHGVQVTAMSLKDRGLGCAYTAGLDVSLTRQDGAVCVLTAADLPFEFSDLDEYLGLPPNARQGVVIGSKAHRKSQVHRPIFRKLLSTCFLLLRWALLGMRTRDCQGSFFLSPEAVRTLRPSLKSTGFFVTTELCYFAENQGWQVLEVPIRHADSGKTSTVSPVRDGLRMLRALLALKFQSPTATPSVFTFPKIRAWETFLSLGIGASVFVFFLGWKILNPSFYDWLMKGDGANHLIGWRFFRDTPWTFPLGQMPDFPPGIGSHLLQSDSIPIVAIVSKLFSPLLSAEFQYFGLWLFACYLLHGFFAYRVLSFLTRDWILRLLGAALLTLSPVLLHRTGHYALCAQWIVLFHLYWGIQTSVSRARHPETLPWTGYFVLALFLTGVHPYLLLMHLALTYASVFAVFRHARGRAARGLLLKSVLLFAATVASAGCLGYFSVSDPKALTWGYLSTDLLALINPQRHSDWMPTLRYSGVGEGFAYLGLGFICLAVFLWWEKRKRREEFLTVRQSYFDRTSFLAVFALAVYALSPRVKLGGNTVLNLQWPYLLLGPLPEIFRCTGRFIWPFYYWVMVRLLAGTVQLHTRKTAIVLLVTVFALQLLDMHTWFNDRASRTADYAWNTLPDPRWKQLAQDATAVRLVPPSLAAEFEHCAKDTQLAYPTYLSAAILAAGAGRPINSCHTGRLPTKKVMAYCNSFVTDWKKGNAEKGPLYLVEPRLMPAPKHLKCEQIDAIYACR